MPESLSAEQVVGSRTIIGIDTHEHSDNLCPKKLALSPPELHMIDGDTLSDLLEKKLQELTTRINLPQCILATEEPFADSRSSLQDQVLSFVSSTPTEQHRSFHPYHFSDKLDRVHGYHSSDGGPVFHKNQQFQKVMEDQSYSNKSENGIDPGCRHPISVTVSESPSV
ncbi:hypothetical protein TanjilG_22590 [Lupinus angustifolius]|uniref:Uncharacterized protein n=1 Tax=Lupinus angustifolius TaxID=3871 RepID=A0A4P1RSK5_LUPAN|nr:hypothetical protein TanjilG_22590 [Lupinus angustifolius]